MAASPTQPSEATKAPETGTTMFNITELLRYTTTGKYHRVHSEHVQVCRGVHMYVSWYLILSVCECVHACVCVVLSLLA